MILWIKYVLRMISEKDYLLLKSQELNIKADKLRTKRAQVAAQLRGLL